MEMYTSALALLALCCGLICPGNFSPVQTSLTANDLSHYFDEPESTEYEIVDIDQQEGDVSKQINFKAFGRDMSMFLEPVVDGLFTASHHKCHYEGKLVDGSEANIAISTCDGLRGYVSVAGNTFYITKVSDVHAMKVPGVEDPHIIFKAKSPGASSCTRNAERPLNRKRRSIDDGHEEQELSAKFLDVTVYFDQYCNFTEEDVLTRFNMVRQIFKETKYLKVNVQRITPFNEIELRFEAVRGIGELGDVAIDTLTVKDSPLLQDSCYNGLGIGYGMIPDDALTASSSYGIYYAPKYSRLNSFANPPGKGGWSAGYIDLHQWIQVDLGEPHLVTGIAVQAREDSSEWVSSYKVSYKLDYYTSSWEYTHILCGYTANPEKRAIRAHFRQPLRARYVRVHPLTWHSYISMRWEVYGCKESLNIPENRTVSPTIIPPVITKMGSSESTSNSREPDSRTPLKMGNNTQHPNSLITIDVSDGNMITNTTDVSSINMPENLQDGKRYSLVLVEIICIAIGLALLIVSILIIACLTRKLKRRKEEDCNTPAQSRRRLLYNAYECIDDLKSRSIINNAYSAYSINSFIDKDAVYQDISDIKRRDETKRQDRTTSVRCREKELVPKIITVSRSKTWSHNDDFKERTLPRKSSSMGNERRPEMFIRHPLSKKAPPRIEFRCKVPRTPPPPVPCQSEHANTFHVREYCSAPELPRPRPHSDQNLHNDTGSKLNLRHTVFLPPFNMHVQKTRDLSIVRMSNLTDSLEYSDAIYAEPRDTLLDYEAKTSLAKSKDSAFDFESDPEDETIWEDNPIYEDSDSLSDTDYTTSTLDYSESNVLFRLGCFSDYDEMGNDFLRKSHIYSEIPDIN